MTGQSGGGGLQPTQTVSGVLAGLLTAPSFAAGSVPAELGYARVTATQSGISATVLTDLTGLTTTVTVGTRPIMVELFLPQFDAGSGAGASCVAALIDVTAGVQVGVVVVNTGDGAGTFVSCKVRLTPAVGSRTYKAQAHGDGTTAGRMSAAATEPAWIRVYEV